MNTFLKFGCKKFAINNDSNDYNQSDIEDIVSNRADNEFIIFAQLNTERFDQIRGQSFNAHPQKSKRKEDVKGQSNKE